VRPFHVVHGAIHVPLLIVALGRARPIWVAELVLLLLLSGVEGAFISDCLHLFRRPGVLHSELMDQGWVLESFLEEHDNRLVVNLQDDIPLVAKALDKFPKGLSHFLYYAGYIPVNSRMHTCGMKVASE
jgi:5,10-methenyltetrahydromethanopterin hydrogenase